MADDGPGLLGGGEFVSGGLGDSFHFTRSGHAPAESDKAVDRIREINTLLELATNNIAHDTIKDKPEYAEDILKGLIERRTGQRPTDAEVEFLLKLAPHTKAMTALVELAEILSDPAEALSETQYKRLFEVSGAHLDDLEKLAALNLGDFGLRAQDDLNIIKGVLIAAVDEIEKLIIENPELAKRLAGKAGLDAEAGPAAPLPAATTPFISVAREKDWGPGPERKEPGWFRRNLGKLAFWSLVLASTALSLMAFFNSLKEADQKRAQEKAEIAEQIAARDAFNASAAASKQLSDDPALAAEKYQDGASATRLVGTLERAPTLPELRGADLTEVCSETAPCAVAGGSFDESLYAPSPLVLSAQPAVSGEAPTAVAVAALELDPDAVRNLGLKMWAERLAFQRPDFAVEPVLEEISPIISSTPAVPTAINAQDSGPVRSSLSEGFDGIRADAVSLVAPRFSYVSEAAKGAAGNIRIFAAARLATLKEAVGLPKAPSALGGSNAPSSPAVALGAPRSLAEDRAAALDPVVIAPSFAPAPKPRPAPDAAPVVATIAPAAPAAAAASTPFTTAPTIEEPAARAYAGGAPAAPKAGVGVAQVAFNDNVEPPAPVAKFVSHNQGYVQSKGPPRAAKPLPDLDEIAKSVSGLYFQAPQAQAALEEAVGALEFQSPAPAPAPEAGPTNATVTVTSSLWKAVEGAMTERGLSPTNGAIAKKIEFIAAKYGINPDVIQKGASFEFSIAAPDSAPVPKAKPAQSVTPDMDEMAQAYNAYYR